MNVPHKFVYIWTSGDIAHIVANSQLEASIYVQQSLHKFVDTAYIIKRHAIIADFHDSNRHLVGNVNQCDVIMERAKISTEIYYPTVSNIFSKNQKSRLLFGKKARG